ncbi:unnamed protein product [Moneuplotes crassus]|uniref:ABC transporter domain-containing protein n=1 Tax=Euplotes crassus TaxID=5936 RepID=A0AAD1XZ34_EUPCR|nr:unnamed protein product [Moneuplotes crassus]
MNKVEHDDFKSVDYQKHNDDLEEKVPDVVNSIQKNSNESDDSEEEDLPSYIIEKEGYASTKVSYQRRALFRKSVSLQFRQMGTNLCQLVTPIVSLLLIILLKNIADDNISEYVSAPIYDDIPYVLNFPIAPIGEMGLGLTLTSCEQWYMYGFDDDIDQESRDFFGHNEGLPIYSPISDGMLDGGKNILQTACPSSERATPYFKERNASETINQYLFRTLEHLNEQNIDFKERDSVVPDLDLLPDGAFNISEVNEKRLRYNVQVDDLRYIQYHRNNGITKLGIWNDFANRISYFIRTIEGQISAADLINKAYISKLFPKTTVYTGIQMMPSSPSFTQEIMKMIHLLGGGLFPLSLCLLLPVFIYNIVLEKEQKLIEIMKMNGLRMYNYWIISFIIDMILYIITVIIFILFGRFVLQLSFFYETSYLVLCVFFLGWGICQISLGFFFSVFLNQAQTASIVGYLFSIWITLIAISLNITIFSPPKEMSWWLMLYPAFPYTRFFFLIAVACGDEKCVGSFNDLSTEAIRCLSLMYAEAIIFMLAALYLHQVVPQTYGVPKHPLFLCRAMKCKKKVHIEEEFRRSVHEEENSQSDHPEELVNEDEDSKKEREEVYNLDKDSYHKYPLIIKDIRKVYPASNGRPPKVATKKFCLRIKKGEVFGLLGPNGAGKTTLISILTGLYRPDSGNAWVAGFNIRNDLEQIQLQMGVCPQFDILWSDLTVQEHLLFYARLKGIPPKEESEKVEEAMQGVLLEKFAKFKVSQLSGGMKRRLSVAISLVGDPKIVYLDEPSTGLDPENRRQLWDILSEIKTSKALMITTHSMEEADVLCQRIGIVTEGVLRCIGPQIKLKTEYNLYINCHNEEDLIAQKDQELSGPLDQNLYNTREESKTGGFIQPSSNLMKTHDTVTKFSDLTFSTVKTFIFKLLPNVSLLQEFNGNFIFQIPIEGFDAIKLFSEMEKNKRSLQISDWGISQCSLEDVFTRICDPKEEQKS